MYTNEELKKYENKPVTVFSEKQKFVGKLIRNPHKNPMYAVAYFDQETSKPRFMEIDPDMIHQIMEGKGIQIEMMTNRFSIGFRHFPELEAKITEILAENGFSC